MTLQEIQEMPILDFLNIWNDHRKVVSECRFYGVRRSEWNEGHVRELNYLLSTGEVLHKVEEEEKKKSRPMKRISFIYNDKDILTWEQLKSMHPELHLGSIQTSLKTNKFYQNRKKTIKLTKA